MLACIQEHPFLCLYASFLKFQNIIVLNLFAHPYHKYLLNQIVKYQNLVRIHT